MIEIKHSDSDTKGIFSLFIDGEEAGEMTYSRAGDKIIIIDHTGVRPQFEGHGYGKHLVKAGVEFARKENLKVIPLCPYANAIIKKTPEYQDVLRK